MKLIRQIRALANMRDNEGVRELLNSIATAPDAHSIRFKGFGPCNDWQDIYLFYSEGEVAFVLVDDKGIEGELADEERFNDEEPLWFSEHSHRVSPFAQVRTLMLAFREIARFIQNPVVRSCICVLITNAGIINYDDMRREFDKLDGAVFYEERNIDVPFCISENEGPATELIDFFQIQRSLCKYINDLFDPFERYVCAPSHDKTEVDKDDEDDGLGTDCHEEDEPTTDASGYFSPCDIDSFFSPNDPDFKAKEECVNQATGEKFSIEKPADMPPVSILEPVVDPHAFLNEMIGLKQLKSSISDIVAYAKFRNKVKSEFPSASPMPANLHTIIVGNPGTGKTTMCRIYGGLLKQAGVLSRGHTVVASRSSFIGQQFGTEELRMRQCLKLAQGGCLFIDEAAQLFDNPHPHDPGRGALQLLLQCLSEEENRDIAVVIALYANDKSLDRLYALNPGIKSRFVNVLAFPDYTWDEMVSISRQKAKAQSFAFTPGAWRRFCEVLKDIFDHRDKNYGNAREAVNLLQRCVIKHAVRCERQGVTGPDLLKLTTADIVDAKPAAPSGKIGFGK